ncbi:hypothetical protein CEUSTIGMA_g8564.t1 [Chlamydomonas eustigma]|uniref:Nucleotidyl transferase domain-containing protein n=1 Tax=Chlamydomonas eustigma TaxID=1157962 RepID=A0A250XEE0_9CHLO|nr:hypothetical protein CEUSTIGMA_g8564.t1 [Chlamydomonas eustigma]|eukprot:GAX81130.1 hypothetical protein CEUSTIGMA_g8564.t1 [Chlamydomonas eustigma]
MLIPLPPIMNKAKIIVLCGGFKSVLTDSAPASQGDSAFSRAALSAFPQESPGYPVDPNVGRKTPPSEILSVTHLLRALENVKRLQPLLDHVYFVVDEAAKHSFLGFLAEDKNGLIGERNVISNGARSISEWRSDLADLEIALQVVGMGCSVFVISSDLLFLPGYNFQRLVEHSLVRGKDLLGFSTLSYGDCVLLDGAATFWSVRMADSAPLPPLAEVRALPVDTPLQEGSDIAEDLIYLKASTLPAALQILSSQGLTKTTKGTLPGLAAALMSQGLPVCGLDLLGAPARLRLQTSLSVDYAQSLMYCISTQRGSSSTMTSNSRQETSNESTAAVSHLLDAFNLGYFGVRNGTPTAGSEGSNERKQLPSTFYMTAYRRFGADMMK